MPAFPFVGSCAVNFVSEATLFAARPKVDRVVVEARIGSREAVSARFEGNTVTSRWQNTGRSQPHIKKG